MEYQLPRLTKMLTHLDNQDEKPKIGVLKKELESVRKHRKQYRTKRLSVPVPVVSLVGYTNAGKSTLLNQLTWANVLDEDRLFATLDPTTRRIQLSSYAKSFNPTITICIYTDVRGYGALLAYSGLLACFIDVKPSASQQSAG
ncbi:GTP-binding protein, HflX [Tanacetum coccineum]|uniref:GTP-binding protein, HflX n=1 Tax=Tanacetum coccineum TaxID=301880 RepID=A0ABQ5J0D8_9ASTR